MSRVYASHPHRNSKLVTFLVAGFLVVVGALGANRAGLGSAASGTNPYGIIDSCVLSGSSTVISGWAADPQLTTASSAPSVSINVGGYVATASTGNNYRTSAITGYIHRYHPGDPTPGEYGFTVQYSGLYKGGSYAVNGTAFNVGAGSNAGLVVNQTVVYDGVSHNVFTGGKVPDACLANAPSPPPAPTPKPSPAPKPVTKTTSKPSTPAAPTPAAPANNADGTVAVGTTSAVVKVPADGAAKVHVNYAVSGGPSLSTDDQAVSGDTASIVLQSLLPKTEYSYQIVRTGGNNASSTSGSASFKTGGYVISIMFEDAKGKPVSGIKGQLNDDDTTKATSDKNGTMTFKDLDGGSYAVVFTYAGHKHELDYDTSSGSGSGNEDQPTVLTDTIDVSQFTSTTPTQSSSHAGAVILLIVILLLLGVGGWFVFRKLRRRSSSIALTASGTSGTTTDIIDQKMLQHYTDNPPPVTPHPPHMSESLRDMVIKSMHEQAAKRQHDGTQGPKPPTVPGQS